MQNCALDADKKSFKRKFLFLVHPKSGKGGPCKIVEEILIFFNSLALTCKQACEGSSSNSMVTGQGPKTQRKRIFSFDQRNCGLKSMRRIPVALFFSLYPRHHLALEADRLLGMHGSGGKLKPQLFIKGAIKRGL